jgi:hypothetical protein
MPSSRRCGRGKRRERGAPPGTTRLDLSVPEIQHLLTHVVFQQQPPDPRLVIACSRWRRKHQAAAGRAHYRRRQHDSQL